MEQTTSNGQMPSFYDRQIAAIHNLPDVTTVQPYMVRVVPPLGIGGAMMFTVQTMRQRETGDYVFVEVVEGERATRIVLTPAVSDAIARQRDALTSKNRRKGAAAAVKTRAARGIEPGFLKRKKK